MSQCIVFCGRANSGPKLCGVKSDPIKWRRAEKNNIQLGWMTCVCVHVLLFYNASTFYI